MSIRHPIFKLMSLLTVLTMLLSPLSPLVSEALAYAPNDNDPPIAETGLVFRTTVSLRQPTDRARLDKLGVATPRQSGGRYGPVPWPV